MAKFTRDYDPFKRRGRSAPVSEKASGTSRFRILRSLRGLNHSRLCIAVAEGFATMGHLHHEPIDERGSGSRGASRRSRHAERDVVEPDRT